MNRNIPPAIKEINSFLIVEPENRRLSNGIPLFILNTGVNEMVKIELMFPAGNWFQKVPVAAFAVNNMLIEGSRNYTSAQISEWIDYYGAQLGYNVDKDNAYVSLLCMKKFLPNVLEIFEDIVKGATFPEYEFEIFRKKNKQQFLVENTKVRNIARTSHSNILFGDHHPYGYILKDSDFDQLTRKDLIEHYRKCYQSRYCKMIVSGKADEEVIGMVEKHFGSGEWNNPEENISPFFQIQSSQEKKLLVEKDDAVQNAVRIGKILFNKTHPDFIKVSVLNCILGGYFGSRLMKKIREEKGYTYGINSLLVEFRNAGYLAIISELGPDVTRDALNDIYEEIRKLNEELVPEDELIRVKNYLLGEVLRMFDGPFAQSESLLAVLETGLDYKYYQDLVQTVKSITSEELLQTARKYMDPGSFSEVVVGLKF